MKKKSTIELEEFLNRIREGLSVLEALGLSHADLNQVSFEQLLENPDDIGDGVIKVETKLDTLFLGVFDNLFVKHHDDKIRYLFFGNTNNAPLIIRIFQTLFKKFGGGIYDDSRFASFIRKDKVVSLSKGKFKSKKDALFHTWSSGNNSISLSYHTSPLRQFRLLITQNHPQVPDIAIRTKGTIEHALNFDINSILNQQEVSQSVIIEKGAVKYIDYVFNLEHLVLEVFDILRIRLFSPVRKFDLMVHSNLELICSKSIDYTKMARIASGLISLYSKDTLGSEELMPYEVDNLQEGHWVGRMWYLNKSHALWSSSRDAENMAYSLSLSYDKKRDGFKLDIVGYNELVKLSN
ncbi:hypothetical protein FNT36_20750 [Hymenobacter setariae]|uniref:Uncharacterized protein n=1 Tax=Hymenobacter setariae TaxID=2594794 RepID=A0A558BQ24_9BACT|nr:hypothetical protein [Hymenobacter setariae]TVT38611.1 hypothetical protein FNT36_20750 [Hymenobacter setariae]